MPLVSKTNSTMNNPENKRWYFKVPGAAYAYDIWAGPSERSARAAIRTFYGVSRLPSGMEIWPA
jgi:hypothetical protein